MEDSHSDEEDKLAVKLKLSDKDYLVKSIKENLEIHYFMYKNENDKKHYMTYKKNK